MTRTRKAVAVTTMIAVTGGVAFAIAMQPWRGGGGDGPRYTTVRVERGALAAKVTATGTLSARNTIEVGAQVSGRVDAILVDFNDKVTKGQVIARLDRSVLSTQLTQARANLELARANVTKAEVSVRDTARQLERQRGLRTQDLIAATVVEQAEVAADTAAASLAAARAQAHQARAAVQQAELNLGYATIVSPVDGVVISRDVDVGQTVAASLQAPTLFTIAEDLRRMQIDTSVAESDVGRIAAAMTATFTVDAFAGRKFTGTVRQVRNAPSTVSNVVTYNAVIDVDNVEGELRPGMTANVTFVLAEVSDAVLIPAAATRFKPSMAQVMAMLGSGGRPPRGSGSGGSGGFTPPPGFAPPSGGFPSGGGGPPGNGAPGSSSAPDRKVVWKLVGGVPRPVPIRISVSDGSRSALAEGDVAAGDELITEVSGIAETTMRPPGEVF